MQLHVTINRNDYSNKLIVVWNTTLGNWNDIVTECLQSGSNVEFLATVEKEINDKVIYYVPNLQGPLLLTSFTHVALILTCIGTHIHYKVWD